MIFVITDHPKAVSKAIRDKLHVGVTQWQAKGTHSQREKAILFCTVLRADTELAKSLVLERDASAFIVMGQAGSRSGGFVKPKELKKT